MKETVLLLAFFGYAAFCFVVFFAAVWLMLSKYDEDPGE